MTHLIGKRRYASETYPTVSRPGTGVVTNKVLVDGADTTPGFLAEKFVAGDGFRLTVLNPGGNEQLEISVIVPFEITSFTTPTTLLEIGQTLSTPAFTAAYNEAPISAVLTDNQGNPPQNFVSPFTNITSANSYTKTAIGNSVTWTDTATTTDSGSDARSVSATWGAKNFYGVAAPGGSSEAFIEALPSNVVSTSKTVPNFAVNVTVGNALYYANPTSEGMPTLYDNDTGFQIDMTLVSTTIAVTNTFGVTVNYTLQQSTFTGLGNLNVRVQ